MDQNYIVSLYVVQTADKTYFAGFDTEKGRANFVKDPLAAKHFTNKYDIKLRPEEMIRELTIDLSKSDVNVSEPFRPQRKKAEKKAA